VYVFGGAVRAVTLATIGPVSFRVAGEASWISAATSR
jgi:hypothetical protein